MSKMNWLFLKIDFIFGGTKWQETVFDAVSLKILLCRQTQKSWDVIYYLIDRKLADKP